VQVDELRERNQQKAQEEAKRGPTRSELDAVPIAEAIEAFHARGDLVVGIPAHLAGRGGVVPDAARWTGLDAFRADLGMDKGIDTRHQSWQVEPTAMELFAQAVGADQTLFSTNGTSQNVRVALLAAVRPGETVVMARNGHKSAFAGLVLSGARPIYVDPVYDARWQVAHGVDPAELQRVLDAHPEARAVMVFTPTYYGVGSDVAALADVAHAHDIPLLTDDAWGLDYAFCSRLPRSAMESGADLAIGSVHKTLTGLSQTACSASGASASTPAGCSSSSSSSSRPAPHPCCCRPSTPLAASSSATASAYSGARSTSRTGYASRLMTFPASISCLTTSSAVRGPHRSTRRM
jgi:arginine decarboxylase